ncbi:SDR family NAD(P)-dependent oxidoreductase [Salipiger marinus]|jgi:NAD(P)-dependent dehydrogenase (short-subunit alcohol dehydrogenase family)|uniref:NAD(P)-dependent dehydrogenase, short-chain alcohol dehydrogenase family n=1 Tax=Salipiger marinus TaxID=555512 RepID=A0A1G8MHW8_9RHOB|nr:MULTISPECIES: SDR family NAD(P)-dependent oxidoreductase [Salipiger]HBM60093.1 SDR family NAD(P)-dependent oxidoreductase [Citreicella sp.]MCD1617616.1 SDR family oxidoreductase [Salipiger manganoxidans]MEB3419576.1 SDR family NAD(P)-dependent oxidoreductase [Salipiger manganoxidans]SDI67638.1 NAD(P)-dependent dehydrogenase, short-chain alcohol dehydrogenase family [Salipiger marinus]HBT01495.1 SDR family NAD(P)-dependent oxidoreductase [Citreicella sp.]
MEQKTLLLTGASRGIGHATVKVFQAAGWRVMTVSRSPFDARCPWHAGNTDHFQGDLADPVARADLVARVRETLGGQGLNAIVNNAGISPKGPAGERMGIAGSDDDLWAQVLAVNLVGPATLMRDLLPELARGRGAVVNVGSIVGSRVHPFAGVAYACSKAALAALTREAAAELGPRGIRVNMVTPGEIETEILSPGTEDMAQIIPLRRLGKPDEVARVVLFLCSEQASYVNGASIDVNGGQHA